MDGYTGVQKIREDKKARNIPLIALTARAMKGDKEQIIEAGCDDYISKPIDPEGILKKIDEWMGENVLISGFGKFYVHTRKERWGRNPQTGKNRDRQKMLLTI